MPIMLVMLAAVMLAAGCGSSSASGGVSILTTSMPNGDVNSPYTETLQATGGTVPYTWSLTSGTLPAGLGLDANTGTIDGTPTAATSASITVEVVDSATPANSASATFTFSIAAVNITTKSLPNGSLNNPYNATLQATGGTLPYTWTVSSGALPTGLTLSSAGAITGTPTAGGVASFTVQVTDSEKPAVSTTATLSISISPVSLTNTSLPNGIVGAPYSFTPNALGGVAPYTWSMPSGALPQGLSFDPTTGDITGTPTAAGTSFFVIKVADAEAPAKSPSAICS